VSWVVRKGRNALKLFHRTDAAQEILDRGFRDGEGTYLTTRRFRGVWLSDEPLDENDGVAGSTLLMIEIPEEVVASWEWVEEGKGYREFLVPADRVNQYGPPTIVDV
jgi:hypothetical protein